MKSTRTLTNALIASILFLAGGYLVAEGIFRLVAEPQTVKSWFTVAMYRPEVGSLQAFTTQAFTLTFLNPPLYLFLACLLWLEKVFPARPEQKVFSVSLAQDFVWFFFEKFLLAAITTTYVSFLTFFYYRYLDFLTVTAIGHWPESLRFIWGVLVGDLFGWFHHWVRHKIPVLWQFHTIHHSQKELNPLTDLRYHIVEYLATRTIQTFPLLMLAINIPEIIYFSILHAAFTRFYHSNIKMNLGPLRYIFVTPQSHRIHHSVEQRHQDRNFGVLFSVWDYLFGTQHKQYDEYPETGILDPDFPHERSVKGLRLLWTPIAQHIYPFKVIARTILRKAKKYQDVSNRGNPRGHEHKEHS